MECIIGIDVSKDKLDIYITSQESHHKIDNNESSIKLFIKKVLKDLSVKLVLMEYTGGYEKACFRVFSTTGYAVHMANPSKVHYFIKSKGQLAKTDKIDSKMLALYGKGNELKACKYDPLRESLKALSSRISQVKGELTRERCRYSMESDKLSQSSLRRVIKYLEGEVDFLQEKIKKIISSNEELVRRKELLMSCKGIGETAAILLICEFPELGNLTPKSAASLSGLAPVNRDSGKKSGKRMVNHSRSDVKKVLYLCSLSASIHNTQCRHHYKKLISKGKVPKVALTAVARKLVVTLNAMLREGKPWSADYQHSC